MKNIKRLATQFREAINVAKDDRMFLREAVFREFPCGCCGIASELLAQFLLEGGIHTYYVCGNYREGGFDNFQSHAWLVTENDIIIDITGDQFRYEPVFLNYNKSVYVGPMDDFHNLFEIDFGRSDVCHHGQPDLYRKIISCIK
jgi:hypothetical protein